MGALADFFANASCDIEDRNNLTNENWDYSLRGTENVEYSRAGVQVVLFLAGVVLNLYVFGRILWKGLHSEPMYMLLLNLCVADLVMCFVPILFNITTGFNGHYSFGNTDYIRCHICKISVVFGLTFLVVTFTVVLLSVDRCLYFVRPLKYPIYVTTRRAAVAIVIIWVLSILQYAPSLAGYGDVVFSVSCGVNFFTETNIKHGILFMAVNILIYSAVAMVILVTNILIVRAVLKQRKMGEAAMIEMQAAGSMDPTRPESMREKFKREAQKHFKLLKVFGFILLVNFITIIPALVMVITVLSGAIEYGYFSFMVLCAASRVALHPLVEICLTPEIRIKDTCSASVCRYSCSNAAD